MKDKDIVEITFDFEKMRGNLLKEDLLIFLKFWVGKMLRLLLGDINVAMPVKIKGTPGEVKSFVNALSKEKSYVESYRQYGLDDPKTFQSRGRRTRAIADFERKTGLTWPFER